jgi:hypothetical protein
LAQAAALTAVAREEKYKILVLAIYTGTVFITLVWIILMLRTCRENPTVPGTVIRAYDYPSIRYGRAVLVWTVILAGVLLYLGKEGLLPNQTPRVAFSAVAIEIDTYNYTDWAKKLDDEQRPMDRWIEKLSQTARKVTDGENFFIVKQRSPFPESYKSFPVTLKCDAYLGARVAFLVRPAEKGYRPTYRQVPFGDPENPELSADTLLLDDPNRGEYLLMLIFARDRNSKRKEVPTKDNLNADLKPNFPGQTPVP